MPESNDRYPDSANPQSVEDGLRYQDFVCDQLAIHTGLHVQNYCSRLYQFQKGENRQGIEIKFDRHASASPNGGLSIEVAEKTRNDPAAPWRHSGICRKDNSWLYVHGDWKVIYLFQKTLLVSHYEKRMHEPNFLNEKHGTIRTFYLTYDLANKWAALIIRPESAPTE